MEKKLILLGDSAIILKQFVDDCIDLTVTSPPYDNLRSYDDFSFNFKDIADQLFRVTKEGGVVVWIVSDETIEGGETNTSFEQAMYFKNIGFKRKTHIYKKHSPRFPNKNDYSSIFEFMFILSKGKIKTFNPIRKEKVKYANYVHNATNRDKNGILVTRKIKYNEYKTASNIWEYPSGFNVSTTDRIAFDHPAIMPELLVENIIKSWSNEGDLVLDPFLGSGTTYKMALKLNRKPIGIEINPDYIRIAKQRLTPYIQQQKMENWIKT